MSELLVIRDLSASVEDKEILKGVNLSVGAGEIHVIMGPNGAGKSTLAYTLMGHPRYKVLGGEALLDGEDLFAKKVDERAKSGLFLSFQYPEEVPGVTVENFLRTAKGMMTGEAVSVYKFNKDLKGQLKKLNIKEEYASRYLNVGFSGGEKKKNEILQMAVLEPKVAILDETDSGLDVDAIKTVAEGVNAFHNETNSIVIITHYHKLLEYISPDYVHILVDGKIIRSGGMELAKMIDENGFLAITEE